MSKALNFTIRTVPNVSEPGSLALHVVAQKPLSPSSSAGGRSSLMILPE
jgi:hypothetical protein